MSMTIRRLLLGRPIPTHGMEHETLPRYVALPVFSSDALSSVAYATQEMMLALVLVGTFYICFWQALAIVCLLLILTASYNQTIFAYPQGGGAYNVAHDNLGTLPAQVAAVSLMTDYILTVAVSVASGIDAILSAMGKSEDLPLKLLLCMLALWFIVWINLRGVRESGRMFAIPVYIFIFSILTMVAMGLWQLHTGGFAHLELTPKHTFHAVEGLTLFLILRSFSQGCTALTGLEAISNSTAAFRAPKARNAQVTMWWLAFFLGSMMLGITWLAQKLSEIHHLYPTDNGETVDSQIAHAVTGNGTFYWVIQISTFAILVLAANTSFTGFPRLGAMVARDGFLPRQLMSLGDRLVFENGILALGLIASFLILIFRANVDKLIPLYAIGVYMAFTLSQAGMVRRWIRQKGGGWQIRAAMNAIGAFITAVVAIVFGLVKFRDGAWMVIFLIIGATYLLHRIGRHYEAHADRLDPDEFVPPPPGRRHVALVPAFRLDEDVAGAVEYARLITPNVELLQWCGRGAPAIELEGATVTCDRTSRSWRQAIVRRISELRKDKTRITLILCEDLPLSGWVHLVPTLSDLMIKLALLGERGVVVADTRHYRRQSGLPSPAEGGNQRRVPHTSLLLVPRVHRGVLEALAYARAISRDVQALHIEIDPDETPHLREDWERFANDVPMLVLESPFRELRQPLVRYIQALREHKPGCIITVIVPEFVADKWWNKVLHNHAGFLLKVALRNVYGIVLSNPRYFPDVVEIRPAGPQDAESPGTIPATSGPGG